MVKEENKETSKNETNESPLRIYADLSDLNLEERSDVITP